MNVHLKFLNYLLFALNTYSRYQNNAPFTMSTKRVLGYVTRHCQGHRYLFPVSVLCYQVRGPLVQGSSSEFVCASVCIVRCDIYPLHIQLMRGQESGRQIKKREICDWLHNINLFPRHATEFFCLGRSAAL